jgi:riboflavin synthase
MFTGLVEGTAVVSSIRQIGGGIRIKVRPEFDIELQKGDSIAVNGVCLTVVETGDEYAFEVSPETLRSTNFSELKVNSRVNLERSLRLSDRLGGHIVTGHVDGTAVIVGKRREGDYTFYTFETSQDIIRYIVQKGSVAVDGISLTIIAVNGKTFSIAIIPHTLSATNIGDRNVGDKVNIETDIIGKYVERFVHKTGSDDRLMELLREKGFNK